MLTKSNLLATDFILAKSRCKVKKPWSVHLPKFHVFSARKNYLFHSRGLSS